MKEYMIYFRHRCSIIIITNIVITVKIISIPIIIIITALNPLCLPLIVRF